MKHDHSFTFTAAVILAGVVLALVIPTSATDDTPSSSLAGVTATSNNLQNMVAAIAAADAPAASSLNEKASHKGMCHRVNHVDPRA